MDLLLRYGEALGAERLSNVALSEANKAARARAIFRPYHDRIEAELDRRRQAGRCRALARCGRGLLGDSTTKAG